MSKQELEIVAQAMVAKGKGIFAADESMGTIKRRFDSIKIESNENNRRAYREMLFTTKGIEEAISGVILFDETLRTKASDGTPFPELLVQEGHHARHQGRQGARRYSCFSRRDRHRRTGWFARAGQRVQRARRQVRQVARRDHHRRRHSDLYVSVGQRGKRWRATLRCVRRAASCRSSSRKFCSTAITRSNAARK